MDDLVKVAVWIAPGFKCQSLVVPVNAVKVRSLHIFNRDLVLTRQVDDLCQAAFALSALGDPEPFYLPALCPQHFKDRVSPGDPITQSLLPMPVGSLGGVFDYHTQIGEFISDTVRKLIIFCFTQFLAQFEQQLNKGIGA